MPFWFPFGPFGSRPDTLWVLRVLSDLSELYDAGAFDEAYFRRAWLTIVLIGVADEPMSDDAREHLLRWLVQRSGATELGEEAPDVDDVFGVVELSADGSAVESREEEPDVLHLLPAIPIAGRRWKFHLTDQDSNRPAPHGHDIEDHSVVLDPYTGAVTDKHGKALKSAKPKELRKLWSDKSFRNFAARARATLQEQQPWRTDALPPVPEF